MLLSTDGCPSYTDIAPAHSPPIALRSSKVFLLEICKYFANLDLAGSSGSNPEKNGWTTSCLYSFSDKGILMDIGWAFSESKYSFE